MNAIEKAEEVVEQLEKKIIVAERELRELSDKRPALALAATNGDGAALQKLDSGIERAKHERETLEDALRAARWAHTQACEAEIVEDLRRYLDWLRKLRSATTAVTNAIAMASGDCERILARAKDLGIFRSRLGLADVRTDALAIVARACGIEVQVPSLGQAVEISDRENQVHRALSELERRQKLGPPPRPRPPEPATGALAAIARVNRPPMQRTTVGE